MKILNIYIKIFFFWYRLELPRVMELKSQNVCRIKNLNRNLSNCSWIIHKYSCNHSIKYFWRFLVFKWYLSALKWKCPELPQHGLKIGQDTLEYFLQIYSYKTVKSLIAIKTRIIDQTFNKEKTLNGPWQVFLIYFYF